MRTLPPDPNPGDKISASLIRELIRAIRERTPIAGHGMRVSIGPNGSVISSKEETAKKNNYLLPWSFSCSEDENGERTGGWTNCILQVGYDRFLVSEDVTDVSDKGGDRTLIGGTDETDDGVYFVEVDLRNVSATIVCDPEDQRHDIENDIARIWIGTVEDGVLTKGIHHHPVVYSNL